MELTQWDARMDSKMKDLQAKIKLEVRSELRSKLHSLFEQYLGQGNPSIMGNASSSKGKGILGTPPGFPSQEHLIVPPRADLGHSNVLQKGVLLESEHSSFRVDCPHFNGEHFQGWWSKIEQYFEAEGIADHTKVRIVMLHLEGKALDWHHFFVRRHGGIHQVS